MATKTDGRGPLAHIFTAFPSAAATVAIVAALSVVGSSQGVAGALRSDVAPPQAACGTRVDDGLRGIRVRAVPVSDGETLSFEQDPPLLPSNYNGRVTLRGFSVVGDVATLDFHRWNPDNPGGDLETWERTTTRAIGGRLISVFEPGWDPAVLDRMLSRDRIGYDRPTLIGWVTVAGVDRPVTLQWPRRHAPFRHRLIDTAAQYASNVLNIVIPGRDGRAAAGAKGFELSAATEQALKYLSDTYDDIAFVPVAIPIADYGAFHQNVQNAVTGINIAQFNQTSLYGRSQRLQGVELDAGGAAARYEDTNHEMAHQWNSDFDWGRIAGITRAGHQPDAHSPLWTGGESLLGAVLWPSRRVRTTGSAFAIEATPAPAHFHALELYGMGLLPPEQVPDFQVFEDQGQFSATASMIPGVDAPVTGGVRSVTIHDVIREHGARTGPKPTVWRRATVLVSTERLASQGEMDYWNFFAARLADRSGAGTPTYDGFVPFHTATGNAAQLVTVIEPAGRAALSQALETDAPNFGAADWRGVEFTQPVPSRLAPGAVLRLAGRVTATTGRLQSDRALLYRANSPDPSQVLRTGLAHRRFLGRRSIHRGAAGALPAGVYLFWPNSPRGLNCSLTFVVHRPRSIRLNQLS
jgi:hypothetical protein